MKRLFDFCISLCLLILLLPLFAFLWAAVRLDLRGAAIFCQLRPGRDGVPFRMYKFRTMHDIVDAEGHPIEDALRLTSFGRLLRSTSLDELPELWNVLIGDMSLVGPRPLLLEYLPLYSSEQNRRHEVRPGITGWAQVKGRNSLSWDARFRLDVWYIDHQSIWLDFKILAMTVRRVISRDGVSETGKATMSKFTGNR